MGNSIKFNPGITFSAFETRGTLNIDQVELKFLRYHTFCIGLLKLLGKIEDIPIRIFQQIAGEDFPFLNDWHFPDVTKTFGKANAVSTIQYEQAVALAKGAR